MGRRDNGVQIEYAPNHLLIPGEGCRVCRQRDKILQALGLWVLSMWAFGYFVYVLAFGVGLYWAGCGEPSAGRWKRVVLVAACALPVAWIGQMLLIPFTRNNQLDPASMLPNLAIAGYSVCAGLASMWLLGRFSGLRLPAYAGLFALSHAFLILVGIWLGVGLWSGS